MECKLVWLLLIFLACKDNAFILWDQMAINNSRFVGSYKT